MGGYRPSKPAGLTRALVVEQREKGISYHYGNENHATEEISSQEGCAR